MPIDYTLLLTSIETKLIHIENALILVFAITIFMALTNSFEGGLMKWFKH